MIHNFPRYKEDWSTKTIFFDSMFVLTVGLLFINTFVPIFIINVIVLIGIWVYLYLRYIKNHQLYAFILIIYFCSHFSYAVNQGGAFNILAFMSLGLYFIRRKSLSLEIKVKDVAIYGILILFIFSNILGWIFVNKSLQGIVIGALSLAGYILTFIYTSRIRLSPLRLKLFVQITLILVVYSSIVIVNNYLALIPSNLPIFPARARFGSNVVAGMMGWSELSGEHGLITAILFFTLIIQGADKTLGIKKSTLTLGIIFSLFNMIMSRSRSTTILFIVFIIVIFLISVFPFLKTRVKLNRSIGIMIILALILVVFYKAANMQYLFDRFKEIDPLAMTSQNILSGQSINRDYAFSFFFDRLNDRSWWIGYGWGDTNSNRIAWFNDPQTPRAGYHSLYFSLPMLFGWIGSFAFIMIFILIIYRLFRIMQHRASSELLKQFSLALLLMILFFLINEYKIGATRAPHYLMIIWIWLGMGNSVYYNYRLRYPIV